MNMHFHAPFVWTDEFPCMVIVWGEVKDEMNVAKQRSILRIRLRAWREQTVELRAR